MLNVKSYKHERIVRRVFISSTAKIEIKINAIYENRKEIFLFLIPT